VPAKTEEAERQHFISGHWIGAADPPDLQPGQAGAGVPCRLKRTAPFGRGYFLMGEQSGEFSLSFEAPADVNN